jgi:hypothetical protein
MLNVVKLSVIYAQSFNYLNGMLSVVMLNVVKLKIVILSLSQHNDTQYGVSFMLYVSNKPIMPRV